MGGVKGQVHIVHPISNRCTSFSFHINWTNRSWDMSNRVFDLEKNTSKIFEENVAKKEFPTEFIQNLIRCDHEQKDINTKFCSDWLSGSHFILQTSKFLFINVTAATLGQGHQKFIQYIFPDLYFLCPKYLRLSSNGFDVTRKSLCGGGRTRARTRTRTQRRKRTENMKSPQTGVT